MDDQGHVKKEISVFRNGRSQAVRIPKEYEFDTDKVTIWKDGDGVVHLSPVERKKTLIEVLDWLRHIGPIEDFPGDPGDEGLAELDDVDL
ncbi:MULTISPECIES: antitoxin [unclassified Rhizobium]|uniref:antitoxin n=1 Tax=unclassified Rhizobium TaxID=2613769 RepID=UPI0016022FF3|nr:MULTISPECIES: AbrB/MazE/SpoVT family DNA-binding domain-containing protein [unclassified Rhizobium]MBB1249977.1 AbrB/MazE/SpoVT family DNA-binding domain-containing protein [Rhizobium sp. G21]MCV3765909.1 AbrB/MazE/SpoVT family DNA-binding domain-containing protein [Rhizobium sp. TRM95796]